MDLTSVFISNGHLVIEQDKEGGQPDDEFVISEIQPSHKPSFRRQRTRTRVEDLGDIINPYDRMNGIDVEIGPEDDGELVTVVKVSPTPGMPQGSSVGATATGESKLAPSSFDNLDLYIEDLFFLSESTIVVFTRAQELKFFDTASFIPGIYDAQQFYKDFNSGLLTKYRPA
mmetsp:Transcript_24615/g.38242  ORF Transcript_24615/g.38242 Transcript_24615/m.38242 type:complete len:172 (+) Transcript_24615:2520-3035(+)